MNQIFTEIEETKIEELVGDFQAIYERASFLSIQMEQIETEMSDLLKNMTALQKQELDLYAEVSERVGETIEEVKIKAANIALEKKNKNSQN